MDRHVAVFPAKLKVLPQFIFNSRDPIVMGVSIEGGVLKQGTPLCVPSKGVSRLKMSSVKLLFYFFGVQCMIIVDFEKKHQHQVVKF